MRLIHVKTLRLHEFIGNIPPYVILSHTWGQDEVLFADLEEEDGRRARQKNESFAKIENCCAVAAADGFEWVWIDTCCINKSSSAELSEAINSMFAWYYNSSTCYAFLNDVEGQLMEITDATEREQDNSDNNRLKARHITVSERDLDHCRWFTRGWTLQELLAPKHILFFDRYWCELGSKRTLAAQIARVTRIQVDALAVRAWDHYSAAQKFCWASTRSTTRPEDEAYSLLGLFRVNMPLLYGEGHNAFRRLQEEIILQSYDQSIFAWMLSSPEHASYLFHGTSGLLATSPSMFRNSSEFRIIPAMADSVNGAQKEFDILRFTHEHMQKWADNYNNPFEINRGRIVIRQAMMGLLTGMQIVPLTQGDKCEPALVRGVCFTKYYDPFTDHKDVTEAALKTTENLPGRIIKKTEAQSGTDVASDNKGEWTWFKSPIFILPLLCTYQNRPLGLLLQLSDAKSSISNGINIHSASILTRTHAPSLVCLDLYFVGMTTPWKEMYINTYTPRDTTQPRKGGNTNGNVKKKLNVRVKALMDAGYAFVYTAGNMPPEWMYASETGQFFYDSPESADDSPENPSQMILFAHSEEIEEHKISSISWGYSKTQRNIMSRLEGREDMGAENTARTNQGMSGEAVGHIVFEIQLSINGLDVIEILLWK